jgi:hypothetical protein
MFMLHVHIACPCYLSTLPVRVRATSLCPCDMFTTMLHIHACPCSTMLHTHAACLCYTSILRADAAFSSAYPRCMSMRRVKAACPCCMPTLHCLFLHVHAGHSCLCRMSMSMLHVYAHAVSPCPCCMSMSMPHVHVNADLSSLLFIFCKYSR